jgi:hypothetical protein
MPEKDLENGQELNEQPSSSRPVNEIDEFTRKLLDKRAELTLFPDDEDITSSSLQGTISQAQRQQAEQTMMSALNQMRKARGQKEIQEEERQFAQEADEDITSASVQESVKKDTAARARAEKKEQKSVIPQNAARYETRTREDYIEPSETRPPEDKKKSPGLSKTKKWILIAAAAVIVLFGIYYWKVAIYNPAHSVSEEQQQIYDRFVEYADEFDMQSEAEKNELLTIIEQYDKLSDLQKKKIDAYFEDHTGADVKDLYEQILADNNLQEQSQQYFTDLSALFENYSQDLSTQILSYIDRYNSMSQSQKAQIDELSQNATGMNYLDYTNSVIADLQQQAQALQSEIDSLNTDREHYVQFLEGENESTDGNEVLAQYDQSIADKQAQLEGVNAAINARIE